MREEAGRYGLRVSFRNLKFHFLYPHVSLDNLEIWDEKAAIRLAQAETVDVSLSPGRFLSGQSPVSRIRARNFTFHAEEANRPLFDRLRSVSGKREGPMPEILLLGGYVSAGPFGPFKHWEAHVSELRVRDVRFLGTRISFKAEQASGRIALPDAEAGNWPYETVEADLFHNDNVLRIRRFRASGPSSSFRLSGFVDTARREGEVKASGAVDLARWISAGAPYGPRIARFGGGGELDFSAAMAGNLDDPSGSGRLMLRNGRFSGGAPVVAELSVAVSKRKIRVESLKGKLWGGTLAGNGVYDIANRSGEGKLSLSRASFGSAPWKDWGAAWRPAGTGNMEIAISGNAAAVRGALSWRNPDGLERTGGAGSPGGRIVLPFAASVSAEMAPGGEVKVPAFRLHAGDAILSGGGEVSLSDRTIRLAGEFSAPPGKAADYGWAYPISWRSLAGEWEAAGAADRPHVAARVEAQALAVRALPPVPLVVKLTGDPAEAVHFVADIPASVAKATATGTVTGPLSPGPFMVEATVAAREIDFSESGRWVTAVLASLGRDASSSARYTAGLSGAGTGDLQVSIGKEAYSISGALRSDALLVRGIALRGVSAEGGWSLSGGAETWHARAEGKSEEGVFRLAGEGRNGRGEVSGTLDRIDLGKAVPLFVRGTTPRVKGIARLLFAAQRGAGGWELSQLTATVPTLSLDNVTWNEVSAEGSLGAATGTFALSSRSPRMRLSADVRRGGDWPVAFSFAASDVPTDFLAAAAGQAGIPSGGKWKAEAEGTVNAAGLTEGKGFLPETIADLRFSVSAAAPSVSGVVFDAIEASGKKEGATISGEIRSRAPDTLFSYSVNLREPFGFRVAGPFSFGTARNGQREEGKARFSLSGSAEIAGSLRALERTEGSLHVRQFQYREGGFEISAKDAAAQMSPEGIRWAGGTVLAAGSPLRISGKSSWKGDLDVRLEGKLPASAIRLVTDVFDRLEGTMRLDLRITGKWDNPSLVGTGRLDGGVFSFRGYAQLFEDMQADAIISREKLIFEHFEGRSGGGYLDGRGELPLRFDNHQRLFFTADFFDMRFPYPDDLRPVLQGHVELLGPYDDFLVTGEVEVQSARYTKTVRFEKALLDFRRRLADVTARKEKSDFRVRLDIEGIADGTIRIKNNLADAEAKGEFKVVGDASRVIVLGSFDVIDGYVEYQGNKYELKRVGVEFQDPRRNNPRLDARAETKKGNVTVIVSVTGTLEKYEVDLASDPPLSKNDIVSLLSLGVTSQALAGAEGTVGAAAASSLVLGPYKGTVEEGIRGIVGLDKFAIEPSFSPSTRSFEPRFIVGKSFGDRFSVSVSTSVGTSTESNAIAEYQLLENVFLSGAWESATTTREGDLGADVKFRYRYRRFKDFLGGRE